MSRRSGRGARHSGVDWSCLSVAPDGSERWGVVDVNRTGFDGDRDDRKDHSLHQTPCIHRRRSSGPAPAAKDAGRPTTPLCRGRRFRRWTSSRRTQHPDRTTGRVERKRTTIEHMYSICPAPRTRTVKQPSQPPMRQRRPGISTFLAGDTRSRGGPALTPAPSTHTPNQPPSRRHTTQAR